MIHNDKKLVQLEKERRELNVFFCLTGSDRRGGFFDKYELFF